MVRISCAGRAVISRLRERLFTHPIPLAAPVIRMTLPSSFPAMFGNRNCSQRAELGPLIQKAGML